MKEYLEYVVNMSKSPIDGWKGSVRIFVSFVVFTVFFEYILDFNQLYGALITSFFILFVEFLWINMKYFIFYSDK